MKKTKDYMLKENGNSSYNKKLFIKLVGSSKAHLQLGNIKKANELLMSFISLYHNVIIIKDILNIEIICLKEYHRNELDTNKRKIDNKLTACQTALMEYELFCNDKTSFIQSFLTSGKDDIKSETVFGKALQEVIIHLGATKKDVYLNPIMYRFYETRQDKLKEIKKYFNKKSTETLKEYFIKENITLKV